jgi:predicted Zn-dependent protease
LLTQEQRDLMMRLQPGPFGGNRVGWGLALSYGASMRGSPGLARAYADSALPQAEQGARENPDEPSTMMALAAVYSALGRHADAVRLAERAVAIRGKDGFQGPGLHHGLSRVYMMAGEPVKAIEELEYLLTVPSYVSPGFLKVDPSIDALRSHPRFKQLLAAADSIVARGR